MDLCIKADWFSLSSKAFSWETNLRVIKLCRWFHGKIRKLWKGNLYSNANWISKCGEWSIIIYPSRVQTDFLDPIDIAHLLTKYQFSMKLHQIHINRIFNNWNFLDRLLLPNCKLNNKIEKYILLIFPNWSKDIIKHLSGNNREKNIALSPRKNPMSSN